MALRTFTDRDGINWNVWNVVPNTSGAGYQERYRDGWVCFERHGGGSRCRIPLSEVPPGWESLPDDRLDLIRRVAASTSVTAELPKQPDDQRVAIENDALTRKSGPHHAIGADEKP